MNTSFSSGVSSCKPPIVIWWSEFRRCLNHTYNVWETPSAHV